jgi:hypothetical protein
MRPGTVQMVYALMDVACSASRPPRGDQTVLCVRRNKSAPRAVKKDEQSN